MSPEVSSRLLKVKKFSRFVKRFFACCIGLNVLLLFILLLAVIFGPWNLKTSNITLTTHKISFDHVTGFETKALLCVFLVLLFSWLLRFCYHLYKLFDNYTNGEIFTQNSVHYIRQVGINTMLAMPLQFLAPLCVYLLLQVGARLDVMTNPPVSLSFSPLFAGLMIIFLSWIMDIGRQLRDENKEMQDESELVI